MAELGSAFVNIIPKAPGIESELKKMLGDAGAGAGGPAGQKAGSSLLSTLKKTVSVAAVGKILKAAFSAGADLQQSFGGLDTIYGDAAAAAKSYAQSAAQAGISANDYAETAVSFGASLKAAFSGDTTAAMEAANTAIMDMTDNAAKMGTPIESIQQAYQGFAKQNFSLLDNLKLGYGGTQAEMQRLLADATKLTGVKYDISNLGDVYSAIHVIQGELGLTGVAAEEATTTFSGSLGALQASWTNVIAAMTTGEGLDTALQNLSTTAGNFAKNAMQMISNITMQLPTMLSGFFTAGSGIVIEILKGIVSGIPTLLAAIPDMINTLLQGFTAGAGTLATGGGEIIGSLISGVLGAVPLLLAAVPEIIASFFGAITTNGGTLVEAGLGLIAQITIGIAQGIVDMIATAPQIFSEMVSAIGAQDWGSIGGNIISGIIAGVTAAASALWDSLKNLASSALDAAKGALQINSPSRAFADHVGRWIPAGMAVGIEANLSPVNKAISRMTDTATAEFQRAKAPGMTVSRDQSGSMDSLVKAIINRPVVANVAIQGDTRKIFKVVQSENGVRTKATGYNALARA